MARVVVHFLSGGQNSFNVRRWNDAKTKQHATNLTYVLNGGCRILKQDASHQRFHRVSRFEVLIDFEPPNFKQAGDSLRTDQRISVHLGK